MHQELCGGRSGLCEAMKPTKGADLLMFLKKVKFTGKKHPTKLFYLLIDNYSHYLGLSGDDFLFDANGDGPARYNIIHFKQLNTGRYDWIKIGEYNNGTLTLNLTGQKLFMISSI